MARYLFVVMTNAAEGREDDFNRWYDNQHISDVLKVEGFRSAQRFKLPAGATSPAAVYSYLTLYEIETDDLAKTQSALGAVAGTPAMPISDALDTKVVFNVYFEEVGTKILAQDLTAA